MNQHDNPVIACLGLAFKADSDDLRESPAVKVITRLAKISKAPIIVCDPYVELLPTELEKNGVLFLTLDQAIEKANIVVVLTKHAQFLNLDESVFTGKKVIDFVNAM